MKASDLFTQAISQHLESVAATDPLFAVTLQKKNKNIKDCVTYIMNTVQKSGNNAVHHDEVFNMAVHYYDEDDIQPGSPNKARVVVGQTGAVTNQSIVLPVTDKITPKVAEPRKTTKKQFIPENQPSLF